MISFPAMQLGAAPIVVTIDLWHQDTACSILNLVNSVFDERQILFYAHIEVLIYLWISNHFLKIKTGTIF